MGADDILQVLEKGGEFTMNDLIREIGHNPESIKKCMGRLLKDVSEDIQKRKMTEEEKIQIYGKNLGMTIFIYKLK